MEATRAIVASPNVMKHAGREIGLMRDWVNAKRLLGAGGLKVIARKSLKRVCAPKIASFAGSG